jgi:hypothetical protein
MLFGRFGESEFGRPGRSFFRALKGHCYEEGAGGGGGGGGTGKTDPPDAAAELAALKAENEALKAAAKKKPADPDPAADPDLKARADAAAKATAEQKARELKMESAIKFDLGAAEFLKKNESLLPKAVADIFTQAGKERFEDAIAKDSSVKSGLVKAFFEVQANVDLLTSGQKQHLDDWMKLTNTGRQERAQELFSMVFEPAFEMLKRVKTAEQLAKGFGGSTDDEDAYKKKLIERSTKHFKQGEKANA